MVNKKKVDFMYTNTPAAYRHNPLMDSTAQQIAFLFSRVTDYIEDADLLRNKHHYQEFAEQNQRAISIIHGLSSILQTELTPTVSHAWDAYFNSILRNLNVHMIEPDPSLFKRICKNLRHMEQLLKNVDAQNHIMLNPNSAFEHEANNNLNTPINHNHAITDTARPHVMTDISI